MDALTILRKQANEQRQQLETTEAAIRLLSGKGKTTTGRKRRKMSAATRKKMAAAAKARWAKVAKKE